ncbi:hypothetical protein EDB19DRAFT_333969 [Suillus lakei]|nr:hypothetical protein EDB19DRAFT_333969 [Suillus lakei]
MSPATLRRQRRAQPNMTILLSFVILSPSHVNIKIILLSITSISSPPCLADSLIAFLICTPCMLVVNDTGYCFASGDTTQLPLVLQYPPAHFQEDLLASLAVGSTVHVLSSSQWPSTI